MAYIEYIDLVDYALRQASSQFPAQPQVVRFFRKLGSDANGQDAVFVWVVLANNTPAAYLTPASVQPIAASILQKIAENNLNLAAYVYFRLEANQGQLAPGAA